jgi:hypothetical protein
MTDQIKETSQIGKSYRGWMQLQEATGLKKKNSQLYSTVYKRKIFSQQISYSYLVLLCLV